MPHYKLIYFDLRGRGEAIRQLLKVAGVEFEDQQITMEEWPGIKKDMPLGQLPVLEVDGTHQIVPTTTILRYLANEHGLAGKTALERARLDTVGELLYDLDAAAEEWYIAVLGINPNITTPEARADYFKTTVNAILEKWSPLVEKYLLLNGNNGLFLGDKETWVDILGAEVFTKFVEYGDPLCLDAFPHIKALIARVHSNPVICKHIQERKASPM